MTDAGDANARGDGGKRQAKRDSLFLSATLGVAGAPATTVRVRNLSAGGMLVDTAAAMVAGDAVEAELRGIGPVTGMVAWVGDGQAGIAFDDAIDPRKARTTKGERSSLPAYFPVFASKRPGLRPTR